MSERQKQVKTSALIKMETFLNDVYLKIGRGDTFSMDNLAREHKLSGSIATAVKRANIVQKHGKSTWSWLHSKAPDRALALTLTDEVNRMSGNWQAKSLLNRALPQSNSTTLFDQAPSGISERVYLAGCIASGVYASIPITNDPVNPEGVKMLNEKITFATQDLINQLKNLNLKKDEEQKRNDS